MKLSEAYSILELQEDATPEQAKKQYRNLSKKYHPDVNKDPDAENKFKLINEAYQCVQNGKGSDPEPMHNPFSDFGFGFGNFNHRRQEVEPIEIHTTISFKESVLGCKRDIKFSRKIKCKDCNGKGRININNGCDKCGGSGQIAGRQGMMMFLRTCDKCGGRVQVKSCDKCSSGTVDAESSVQVSIPGGVMDNNVLRLNGMGHYVGSIMGIGEQYTDAFLVISVTPELNLTLEDNDVVSHLNISLLEALSGCNRLVKTVLGEQEIQVKPQSKHKDEVIIPNVGVNKQGNQRVILNVEYPKNISKLIDSLKDN